MRNTLNKTLIAAAIFFAATFVYAQKSTEWKEKETFHDVMAKTFHPMEEGNLKPIIARASELSDKAKAWASAMPPKQFDKPVIKELLGKLSTESKALADLVAAKGDEAAIKKSLHALHERFHEVAGACSTDEHKKDKK